MTFCYNHFGDERAIEPIISTLQFTNPMTSSMVALPLIAFGPKVVEPLINALKSDNSNLRKGAAWTLSKIPDARAVEPLLMVLKDDNDGVRQIAAEALRTIRDPRAVETLISILQSDKSENVRQWAVMALGDIQDQRAVEPLMNTVRSDNDPETRRLAAHALRHYPSEEVITTLIAALYDPAGIVPVWARYALNNMQEQQARPYLKQLHQERPELIERAFNTWPWEWVNTSKENRYPDLKIELDEMMGTQGNQVEAAKLHYGRDAHSCPVCGKPANELAWFYFSTPPGTWEKTIGSAGWMTVCDDCHLQVDFFMQAMN